MSGYRTQNDGLSHPGKSVVKKEGLLCSFSAAEIVMGIWKTSVFYVGRDKSGTKLYLFSKKVAKLESLDCNSPVGRSRVNLAASHKRIAVETGLKDYIFLQFLGISVTGVLPRGSKTVFFSLF